MISYCTHALKNWWDDLLGRKEYKRYHEKEFRWNRLGAQILWILSMFFFLFYIVWCFLHTNWKLWFVFIPFISAEIAFFISLVIWGIMLWTRRHHDPAGIHGKTHFSVDVFICTCEEPIDIITPTIVAASRLDYDNKKIYILDDGHQPEVKALAEKYGCHYLARPTHEHAKGGNLNYGFRHSNGDLLLLLDADQVAQPEMIKHLIGYFDIPQVGFVPTPQRFKLPKGDPWGNADTVFYKAMQLGKDNVNAAISCGSCVMYRRSAIESIGGFSEWNIVEDLHTSLCLHDKGWKSIHHDTSYAYGTAPQDIVSHTKQRWQWAIDATRMILFDNPFKRKGLSLVQKIQYFHFGYNYILFGLFLPIFFLVPIYTLFSHQFILLTSITAFIIVRLPYFITQMFANRLMTEGTYSYKTFQAQVGFFATYFHAIAQTVFHPSVIPSYTVTSKKRRKVNFLNRLRLTWPHLLIAGASIAAMIYAAVTIQDDWAFLALNAVWGIWTVVSLSRFIILGLCPQLYQNGD